MESTGGVGQSVVATPSPACDSFATGHSLLQIFLILRGTQLAFKYANRKWHEGVCSEMTSTDVSSGAAPSAPY